MTEANEQILFKNRSPVRRYIVQEIYMQVREQLRITTYRYEHTHIFKKLTAAGYNYRKVGP